MKKQISIHAPHARSDLLPKLHRGFYQHFNPRSSCEERRMVHGSIGSMFHFNPRSSCEERPYSSETSAATSAISIHAPHARSDDSLEEAAAVMLEFQSTLLMRGATAIDGNIETINGFQSTLLMRGATRMILRSMPRHMISIHAPHARSDDMSAIFMIALMDISIHAPHARSDDPELTQWANEIISIHAPHARSDRR